MFTADGLLLEPNDTEIEYREQWVDLCLEELEEALECDFGIKTDSAELIAKLVEQFSRQELASTTDAPDETCPRGICSCYKIMSTCVPHNVL